MITGEERILIENAKHQSSTIEIMNPQDGWDVAVIDEAQMLSDTVRGGAWTRAIIGVCADIVHVCASVNAKDCIIRMIEACGDDYEIIEHERKTPLIVEEGGFKFPRDVKPGDALIVFSRRDVHSVAATVKRNGMTCSVIYGALPYDVRHREAGRFLRKETDVVVATDAIGMGMNLPIRRIVFLQTEKYDGFDRRNLTFPEIKQIAGRAGRFGIYDEGYVTSLKDRKLIRNAIFRNDPTIGNAVIDIPDIFFHSDIRISSIYTAWRDMPDVPGYKKVDVNKKITIAKDLEEIEDNRDIVWRFVRFPIDPDDPHVYSLLKEYYGIVARGNMPNINVDIEHFRPTSLKTQDDLKDLEIRYRIFDFLFSFSSAYMDDKDIPETILHIKNQISDRISQILEDSQFEPRKCITCGAILPWDAIGKECNSCYNNRVEYRYSWRDYY